MWAKTISSDDVKAFVSFGTIIVGIIDKIGLFRVVAGTLTTVLVFQTGVLKNLGATFTSVSKVQAMLGSASQALSAYLTKLSGSAVVATASVTALKVALSFGVGIVLQGVISIITKFVVGLNNSTDAVQKATETFNDFKTAYNSIGNDKSTIKSLANDFEKLSVGVDDYGRNVSLTADEYAKYQSIVKTITDLHPQLITGYDAEGNALANKNGLIENSIRLLEEQQKLELKKIASPNNISDAIDSATEQYKQAKEAFEKVRMDSSLAFSGRKITDSGIETGYVNQIDKYISEVIGKEKSQWESLPEYILNNYKDIYANLDKIKETASQGVGEWDGLNEDEIKSLMAYFTNIRIAIEDMNNASTSANTTLQYVAMAEDGYEKLSDAQKNFVTSYVNGIQVTSEMTDKEMTNIRNSIISLVDTFAQGGVAGNLIDELFRLDSENIPFSDYKSAVENILSQIAEYLDMDKSDPLLANIKIALGIDDSSNPIDLINEKLAELGIKGNDKYLKSLSLPDLQIMFKMLNDPDGDYGSFKEVKEAYISAKEAMEEPAVFSLSLQSDDIDAFQKSMATIKNALSSKNMTTSELLDVMQQFSDFDWSAYGVTGVAGVGKIREALKALTKETYDNLDATLKDNDAIKDIYNTTLDSADGLYTLSEAMERLKTSGTLIETTKDEIKKFGHISTDTLNNIISKYPELNQVVSDYLSGLASTSDVLKELNKAYNVDFDNYVKVIVRKEGLNEKFYKSVLDGLPTWLKKQAEAYGIDFDSFKNLQEAKLAVAKETQIKLAQLASAQQKLDSAFLNLETLDAKGLMTKEDMQEALNAQRALAEAKKQADDMQKIATTFDTTIKTTLDFKGFNTKKKDKSKSKSKKNGTEFSKTIDWATESVKKLEAEISLLNAKLANTNSLDKQISYTEQLIDKQTQLAQAYSSSQSAYQSAYNKSLKKLSKEDQEKVKNGTYKVEEFSGKAKSGSKSGAEKRYNNIKKALELRDSLNASKTSAMEAKAELKNLAITLAGLRWDNATKGVEKLNSDIDVLNAKLENTDSYEERNALLDKILKKEQDIVKKYEDAVAGNKEDVNSSYNAIDKKYRVDANGKAVKAGTKISTKGVTDPEQLTAIIKYNAYVDELRKNTKLLAVEQENYKKSAKDTAIEKYDNKQADLDDKLGIVANNKQDILNAIAEIEELNGNASEAQYRSLIALSNEELDYYKQKKANAKKALKEHKEEDAQYYVLLNDIQECEDAISDARVAQIQWNKAILELPAKELEKFNEQLQETLDTLNEQKDTYDDVIGAVTDALDDEIDKLNEAKKAIEDEDIIGSYANRIKLIKDEINALKSENEERQKAYELQQAQYDLEKARNQKTKKVYREGQGFVYEADTDSIREAQNTLDKLAFDSIIDAKEKEIDSLEKEKELALKSFDEQIKKLNNIKDDWSSIADSFERLASINLANSLLGSNWKDSILSGDTSKFDYMNNIYGNVQKQIANIESQIKANERQIKSINAVADAWAESQLRILDSDKAIEEAVVDNKKEIKANNALIDSSTALAEEWKSTKDAVIKAEQAMYESMVTAKDNERIVYNERVKNLQDYAKQVESITNKVANAIAKTNSSLEVAQSDKKPVSSNTSKTNSGKTNSGKTNSGKVTSVKKQHKGMELGYAGTGRTSEGSFRMIALDELKPDEIPKILQVDEAVLTRLQQGNVMANMVSAYQAGTQATASKINSKTVAQQPSFSIGEIHLHEVNDVSRLSKEIKTSLLPTLNQQLYKK